MTQKRPKMTEAQFMKELAKQRGKMIVGGEGRIRSEVVKVAGNMWTRYCPITKVCKAITGELFWTGRFLAAAKRIGLTQKAAKRIAGAADKPLSKCGVNQKDVRREMFKVLGLKEKVG